MRGEVWAGEWERAVSFTDFLDSVDANEELWRSLYRRVKVPEWVADGMTEVGEVRLLVIAEDWCGDAVNTLPFLARLAELAPNLQLRVIGREEAPALMDAHLTGTSRSIPVAIVLDAALREMGWWGPRPAPLQKWVTETGLSLSREERYRQVRIWYARDRGVTTFQELLSLLETAVGSPT